MNALCRSSQRIRGQSIITISIPTNHLYVVNSYVDGRVKRIIGQGIIIISIIHNEEHNKI